MSKKSEKLSNEAVQYILSRILDNANDMLKEYDGSDYYQGQKQAYYEILDSVKTALIARNQNLKDYGLNIDLERTFL